MPRPTSGDVHVNRPLTNMSLAIFQNPASFIAGQVFPTVPSDRQSDKYYTFDGRAFNRDGLQKRAPGSRAARVGYDLSNDSFSCDLWAGAHPIPDQTRANADQVLDLDQQGMRLVVQMAKIRREKNWVDNFFKGGVWAYDYDGVSGAPGGGQVKQWNDEASTPVEDVANGRLAILGGTGIAPNKLVVGAAVHEKLKTHPDILARVNAGQTPGGPAIVTKQALAAIFEVEQYLVMESIEETSNEGAAAAASFIGGKKAFLCYAAPAPGLMLPSAGYHFAWTGYVGNTQEGYRIKKYYNDDEASDIIELELAIDAKVTATKLGAFWDTVVA